MSDASSLDLRLQLAPVLGRPLRRLGRAPRRCHIQTEQPVHGGLTPFGSEVIRRCEALGVIVDVAHGTEALGRQAAAVPDTTCEVIETTESAGLVEVAVIAFLALLYCPRLSTRTKVQTRRHGGAEAPVEIRVNPRQVEEAADMPGSAFGLAAGERLATSVAALVVERVTSGSAGASPEESDGGHAGRWDDEYGSDSYENLSSILDSGLNQRMVALTSGHATWCQVRRSRRNMDS